MKRLRTTVALDGMRFYARHGVMPQERTAGNWFEVSVRLEYPFEEAMLHDRLEGTINYAEIHEIVRQEMAVPSRLIEHAAGRIRQALTDRFPQIAGGRIRLSKLHPPIPGTVASASVEIEW